MVVSGLLPQAAFPADDLPFGKAVSGRWSAGARLERKGDFRGALAEYEAALAASSRLERPDLEDAQVARLRACAASGSRMRVESARAGLARLEKGGGSPSARDVALAKEAAKAGWVAARAAESRAHPELDDTCP